jgi:hypothetical protein
MPTLLGLIDYSGTRAGRVGWAPPTIGVWIFSHLVGNAHPTLASSTIRVCVGWALPTIGVWIFQGNPDALRFFKR